jgi:hypothetical protein
LIAGLITLPIAMAQARSEAKIKFCLDVLINIMGKCGAGMVEINHLCHINPAIK